VVVILLGAWPAGTGQAPAVETQVAPGVAYRHIRSAPPAGEPWSIHVLAVSRRERSLTIRAVAGRGVDDEMQRELPSTMGARAAQAGEQVVAAVNGDYDLPAPYLGIPDGLSMTSGRLWTTGKPNWPAMAIARSGEPIIAVPEVAIELRSGPRRWRIAALNKPFGEAWGAGPRLFTREFRSAVKSEATFRAVVLERVAPALPLRAERNARAVVTRVHTGAREVPIPPGAIVIAERESAGSRAPATIADLTEGTTVELRIRVRVGGRRVGDAVGGFPILVQEGRRKIAGTPGEYLTRRHPRTAVCYSDRSVFFVVVDGRQPQLSVGVTLEELADLMVSLGCRMAMNTDGGGSSVMAVALPENGARAGARFVAPALRIVNSPSDGQERGRGNAWVIVRKR
jgi:hypothetical protein